MPELIDLAAPTIIELTEEELRAVAGGQNHGEATSDAVHFAQDFVRTHDDVQMGTEVSYFARNGLLPP